MTFNHKTIVGERTASRFYSKLKSNPNSFDLLRLIAATAVLVSHQFQVLGRPQPKIFGLAEPSFLAVLVFFALSGRLITQSWERDPQVRYFLLKRCLRIFPALLVVVVTLTDFVVGPTFTVLGVREYFFNAMTWKYFRCAILWPGHSWLPGVSWTNPYPHAVNSPLWTLPIEFALYLSVLAAGVLGFLRRKYMVSIGVLGLALAAVAPFSGSVNLRNVAMLASMFWWGAWLPVGIKSGRPFDKIGLSLGLVALMVLATVGPDSVARTGQILFAGGLVWLASQVQFGDRITRRLGDLSYGVYIIA